MRKSFTILEETFEVKHFPKLYKMYEISPNNVERQLKSVADAWHEGNVVSAAQALESDLSM